MTIANGGFDSAVTNWTGTNCTLASVAGGQSGNCLELTRTGADLQVAASDAITVTPGAQHTLTFYAKSGTSGAQSFRATVTESGVEKAVTGGTTSAAWVQYSLSYTAAGTAAVINLVKNTSTAGTMLFDTIVFSEVQTAVYASDIFTEVGGILLDASPVRWTLAERLRYLNAGQRQLVIFKPDAYVVNDVFLLASGTKQRLPDGTNSFVNVAGTTLKECIALIKLSRNMGTNGTTAGAAILPIGVDLLDSYNPDWHSATAAAVVQNYIIDERDPKHFYVTPPNTGTQYVEAVYSAMPADIVAGAGPVYTVPITLSNIYRQALTDYVLFACYAKDAALSPENANRAVAFWNQFVTGIDRMDLVKKTYSPNMRQPNPSTEGQ